MNKKSDLLKDTSSLWIEYSHKRYLTLDEIRLRTKMKYKEWERLKNNFKEMRKAQAIPFYFQSFDKLFWYFPADCITEKLIKVEEQGSKLYSEIEKKSYLKNEFINNTSTEEAITSAIFEGANSTRAKARQLIAENREPQNIDEWMLINSNDAMSWIKENKHLEVNLDLLKKIHSIITQNTLKGNIADYIGKFRDDVVYVGSHQGISHDLIEQALEETINLTTKNPRYIPPLLRGALLHYFIGYIHPFFDGNGRCARTLFYFKSMKHDLKFVEFLSISASLKEQGKKYQRAFEKAIQHDGDITYFVDFCIDSIGFALAEVKRKIEYLFKIEDLKQKFKLTTNQIILLQRMALNKFRAISIQEYAQTISRSREIARQELKVLAKLQLLKEEIRGKKFVYLIDSRKLKSLLS